MKHRFLYIMALLLAVATGAWAQDPDPIDLTPSADGTEWTLSTMTEYDVELEMTYYTDEELAAMEEAAFTEGVKLTYDDATGTWMLAKMPGFDVELATETPQGVTLHTITSVTNAEAVVGSAIEGVVAAGTPLLVYNGTDAEQNVTIIPTAEQPVNGLIWDEKFKGTADGKTFDEAAMQSADYYVLSGGKNFAIVQGTGTLAANLCWLQFGKDQPAGARSVNIVFGETTKINSVESGERGVERWHDLLGRKVKKPTKPGVYIKKDKKVVIK